MGAWCLAVAGPTVAQFEVFFSSDYLWVVSPFLYFIVVLQFDYNVSLLWYIAIVRNPSFELNMFVLQQQQNLGRRFGTSKMHLSPLWLWLLSVLRRWLCCCWLLLQFMDFVIVLFCCALLCVHLSFAIILMGKRELVACLVSRDCCVVLPHDATGLSAVCDRGNPDHTHLLFLLYLNRFPDVLPLQVFRCSFPRCRGFVCSLWVKYFLVIFTDTHWLFQGPRVWL